MRMLFIAIAATVLTWIPVFAELGENFSDDTTTASAGQSPHEAHAVTTGVVQEADKVLEMIRMKDEAGKTMSFYVDGGLTPIYGEGGQRISLDALRPGDKLAVHYVVEDFEVRQVSKIQ
jgi:hypothetical protein